MPVATNNLSADNFYSTTLSAGISASDTTISVNSVPTASEGYLVIEPDSSTSREIIYYTSKTGSAVVCPSAALGRGVGGTSAASHSSGSTIQGNVTAQHWLALQDASAMTGLHQYFDESFNDYVVSGATVSLATGLIASVSAGTVYINGRRLTVNAFSKTLTASKETYFDLIETDGSNIATVSYTELNSGVTGSAPVANGMHIGMVRSNASLLATIYQSGHDYLSNPLKQTTPESMSTVGSWTAFTPSWTNLTVGNATQQGRYVKYGTTVICSVNIVFGSTSAMGTNPTMTLPVTASSTMYGSGGLVYCGHAYFVDSGTANYGGFVRMSTTTTISPTIGNASSTYFGESGPSSTVPMTWTTNDQINLYFSYQASS